MDALLTQSLDLDREEYLERRQVIRAVAAARRRLEDELGDRCNFLDPRSDMLLQLVRELELDTLETVEALGAEMVLERLLLRSVPDVPIGEWNAWMDAHVASTIATLSIPGGLQ